MKKNARAPKGSKPKKSIFPRGWDQKRVQAVIDYYDNQTEDEELAEYEAGMALNDMSMMLVPTELVPEIERLIARRRKTAQDVLTHGDT
jgi:hypothetical protein